MDTLPPTPPVPATRRERELALFATALADPRRAVADFQELLEADEPWTLPIPLSLADFIAARLPPGEADAFLSRLAPLWPFALEALARRFDPASTGFVQWPEPEDDLFPEVAHPDSPAPDAAILLMRQASLYLRLCKRFPEMDASSDVAQGILQDTRSLLRESLWDAENQALLCTLPDGSPALDATARALFPLLDPGLPADDAEAVSAASASQFPGGGRPAAWLLLRAMLPQTPWKRVAADVARHPLPPGATPVERWVGDVLSAAFAPPPEPRPLRAAGRHPVLIAAAATALLAILSLAAVLLFRAPADPLPLEQRARIAAARGNHTAAAALYRDAAKASATDRERLAFLAANESFRSADYPAAERLYREILDSSPDAVSARLNLALTLLRQNRPSEALSLYREIAASPSASPDAVRRAREAVDFLSTRAP